MEGFPEGLHLSSLAGEGGEEQQGLEIPDAYIPQGFVVGGPAVIFPYRGMAPDELYGAQASGGDPIKDAPLEDRCGGTIYFERAATGALEAILQAMGVRTAMTAYAACAFSSEDTVTDRYLDQIRLFSYPALQGLLRIEKAALPPEQTLTLGEAVAGFLEAQRGKWNDEWTFSRKLSGTAGGDGDWAKESLAFGFHVENTYWGVYRVWSRAWLVTK
jgi:hypothetical protein